MNKSSVRNKSRLVVLLGIVILMVFLATGCIGGIASIGWSGIVIDDGTLFTGSREGVLASVNINDGSRLKSEYLKGEARTGLFGCSSFYGGGCSGGSSAIAIYGTPAVAGDLVYMAAYNGKIYAYNRENLAVRWVYPRDSYLKPIVAGPVITEGKVFIGDSEGIFRALDAATGDEIWSFVEEEKSRQDRIWSTAAVADGVVYFGSFNKDLYALNISDGSVKWTFSTNGSIMATPLVENGIVYAGSFDKNLYALNASDGSLRWQFTGENWFWSQPIMVEGDIYANNLDGKLYVIEASTGNKKYEYDFNDGLAASPVFTGNAVVVINREGAIYTVSTTTGESRLLVDLEMTVNGPITVHDNIIYLQNDKFEIVRVNATSGSMLQSFLLGS